GYVPEHRDPLILKDTRFAQGPPAFRYRGFFHDDEDILPRPFDARGYPLQTGDVPLAWYRRFFETALRLRMNMVAPYVRVHRRFEVQQLASDWGLYYTSHHYDILVSNPFGLTTFNLAAERGVRPDYDWFSNRDGLLTFWRGGVAENHNLDVIWPVGLRNTSDRAYTWPEGTTDADKARVFREVIGLETGMVRDALPPGRAALFHFTMYSEMLELYRRDPAAFGLPDDVVSVWPDDNDGHMRGLPTDLASRFVASWTQEYFAPAAASARAAYDRYDALLDTPDKLWYASEAVQNLIERLWRRVTGQPFTPFNADTLAVLQARSGRLD